MSEIIPAHLYHPIYIFISIALTLYYYGNLNNGFGLSNKKRGYGIILFYAIAFIFFVGFRPISGFYFGDTINYARIFYFLQGDPNIPYKKEEWIFDYITWWCAQNMDVHSYFLIIEILYIVPVMIACKKICPNNPAVMMLFFMTSFSFFSYGTNGIRNGMACSLIILAIAYVCDKKKKILISLLLAFIAYGCHKSTALPIICMIMCLFFKSTKLFIYFWILSIVISLVAGGQVEAFFSSLGFDDRMSIYSSSNVDASLFSSTGFRWDFLLYSTMPIILGWYCFFKRGIIDKKYSYLLNTYILCNSFWIMMIRASYSNRFAYLSWFLYPIVLSYPLLNFKVFQNQNNHKVALILMAHTAFTVIMSLL